MRGWYAYTDADLERPSLSIALSLLGTREIDTFLKVKQLADSICVLRTSIQNDSKSGYSKDIKIHIIKL